MLAAGIEIEGVSIAGHESFYKLPGFRTLLEFGRAPDDVVGYANVCVTHGHLDHMAGLAHHASRRRLGGLPPARVLVPAAAADDVAAWLAASERLENVDYGVELVAAAPGDSSFSITLLGGAMGRVDDDATAYTGRTAKFDLSADSDWQDAADDEANIDWCRRVIAAVEPQPTLGAYSNGNSDASPEETRRIYGDAKLARLSALKQTWDPDNVFHVNPNVAP